MDERGLRTYFCRVLGVSPSATVEQINLAWQNGVLGERDEACVEELNEAYKMVIDACALRDYMMKLTEARDRLASEAAGCDEGVMEEPAHTQTDWPHPLEIMRDKPDYAMDELAVAAEEAAMLAAADERKRLPLPKQDDFYDRVSTSAVAAAKKRAELLIGQLKEFHGGIEREFVEKMFEFARDIGSTCAKLELDTYLAEQAQNDKRNAIHKFWDFLGSLAPDACLQKPYARRYVRIDYTDHTDHADSTECGGEVHDG